MLIIFGRLFFIQYQNYRLQLTNMLGQRRANELDNFLNHNQISNRMVSPRNPPLNNLTNNYFTNGYQDHNKYERNVSPNTAANGRKPMISPVRSPRNIAPASNPAQRLRTKQDTERSREFYCSNENHKNKKAEYIIHIEQEDMYYCGICATQAASQGFTVNRINSTPAYQQPKKQKIIPHHPAYMNNKRYHELTELMGQIINAQNEYKSKDPRSIHDHYRQQEKLLNDFYDEQIETIQKMRRDHLNDLKIEEENNVKSCESKISTLKELMNDLNSAWDDIEDAFTDIVELIMQEQYQEGMQTYKKTINHFQQKVYEMDNSITNFTTYDIKGLNNKIKSFENKLMQLWTEESSQQEQQIKKKIPEKVVKVGTLPSTVKVLQGNTLKNVHENLPKSHTQANIQRQEPFRNLFPEDESEERLPEASPQFKAF